ncbi:uncharacterized protein METZ01_LOCUS488922, partial [marine metagenome]
MIKEISFKNYRSFKAKQKFPIKKVNILVGPNSAGKSSIIKLFGLLKQSTMHPQGTETINYKGPYVDLQDFKSISHKQQSGEIGISFITDRTLIDDGHFEGWGRKGTKFELSVRKNNYIKLNSFYNSSKSA